jgi:hypothetical protein
MGVDRPLRSRSRHAVTAALTLTLITAPLSSATARSPGQTSNEVAEEIVRVQLRAEQAAQAWRDADFVAEDLAAELVDAEQRVTDSAVKLEAMSATLTEIAVRRFTEVGASGPIVFFTNDPMPPIQRDVLRTIATQAGTLDLDELADVERDLVAGREEVRALKDDVEEAKLELEAQTRSLEADLVELEALRVGRRCGPRTSTVSPTSARPRKRRRLGSRPSGSQPMRQRQRRPRATRQRATRPQPTALRRRRQSRSARPGARASPTPEPPSNRPRRSSVGAGGAAPSRGHTRSATRGGRRGPAGAVTRVST